MAFERTPRSAGSRQAPSAPASRSPFASRPFSAVPDGPLPPGLGELPRPAAPSVVQRMKGSRSKKSAPVKSAPLSIPGQSPSSRAPSASPASSGSSAVVTSGVAGLTLSAIAAYLGLPEATAAAVGAYFGLSAATVFSLLGGVGVAGLLALTVPRLIAKLYSAGGSGQAKASGGEVPRDQPGKISGPQSGKAPKPKSSSSSSGLGQPKPLVISSPASSSSGHQEPPPVALPEANQIKIENLRSLAVKSGGKVEGGKLAHSEIGFVTPQGPLTMVGDQYVNRKSGFREKEVSIQGGLRTTVTRDNLQLAVDRAAAQGALPDPIMHLLDIAILGGGAPAEEQLDPVNAGLGSHDTIPLQRDFNEHEQRAAAHLLSIAAGLKSRRLALDTLSTESFRYKVGNKLQVQVRDAHISRAQMYEAMAGFLAARYTEDPPGAPPTRGDAKAEMDPLVVGVLRGLNGWRDLFDADVIGEHHEVLTVDDKKFEVKGKGRDLKAVFNHFRFLMYMYWRTLYDVHQATE